MENESGSTSFLTFSTFSTKPDRCSRKEKNLTQRRKGAKKDTISLFNSRSLHGEFKLHYPKRRKHFVFFAPLRLCVRNQLHRSGQRRKPDLDSCLTALAVGPG